MSGGATSDSVGTMTTFTVDARGLFTVHKAGCFHLRLAEAAGATFDIESEPTRAAIVEALDEYGDEDGAEGYVEFGPCLRGIS